MHECGPVSQQSNVKYQEFLSESTTNHARLMFAIDTKINHIMSDETKQNNNQINIELSEEISEGTYSNLAIISHSPSEFVLDFVRLVPNVPKAKVKSRIILSPPHAKRLLKALMDNVKRYEAQFGNIEDPEQGMHMPPMNFTPTAQA